MNIGKSKTIYFGREFTYFNYGQKYSIIKFDLKKQEKSISVKNIPTLIFIKKKSTNIDFTRELPKINFGKNFQKLMKNTLLSIHRFLSAYFELHKWTSVPPPFTDENSPRQELTHYYRT